MIEIRNVKKLFYSDTIETIDITNLTFYFTDIEEIHLPNQLKSINSDMCYALYNLTKINIPEHVTTIGNFAFRGCHNLKELTLSNNITSIDNFAFDDTSLTLNFANGKNDALVIPENK